MLAIAMSAEILLPGIRRRRALSLAYASLCQRCQAHFCTASKSIKGHSRIPVSPFALAAAPPTSTASPAAPATSSASLALEPLLAMHDAAHRAEQLVTRDQPDVLRLVALQWAVALPKVDLHIVTAALVRLRQHGDLVMSSAR